MKTKLLTLLLAFMLVGCRAYSDETTLNDGIDVLFENIEEERFLFYDKNTKIIYYFMNVYRENGGCYSFPYISENGKFCRYVDGKIVEIE